MNYQSYKICSNCVMDTTSPDITFDKNGVCNYCLTYLNKIQSSSDIQNKTLHLQKIVKRIKDYNLRKKKKYDCLIGVSGGLDSSFLVYYVVEKLGLKPLLFHVDAGWNSSTSSNNIEKLVDRLNLDLVTKVIDWNEMRDLHLSYFKSGVPSQDTIQDHAFFGAMYKYVEDNDFKFILTGANFSTEFIRAPLAWAYHASDTKQIKDIHKKFGERKIKSFPYYDIFRSRIYLRIFKGVKLYYPLNYINYDKSSAINTLKIKFGWQEYPQKHHESKFTAFFENYWSIKRFGHDRRKLHYSSMILSNQMLRHEAIKKLEHEPINDLELKKEISFVCSKLDITETKLEEYFNLEKKNFKDYKSNFVWINFFTKILNLLNLEKRVF